MEAMSYHGEKPIDLVQLRARLAKMTDEQLQRFGKAARFKVRILVLGINHQIQDVRIYSRPGANFEQAQKDQFRNLLRTKITDRDAQFLGEEAKYGEPSIAHEVCVSKGCLYANIEMHPDERAALQIPIDYETNPNVTRDQKIAFHQQREEYMFDKTLAEAGSAASIIVICGRYHAPALVGRFREAGCLVDAMDIQDEPWYIEDWFEHIMRLW